ncbi:MAG: hypothetical protein MK130_07075 [Puniceicoccaceae bacterium]|nr:hypothetical protein [Puniceicoccaceae bacterium]
MPAIEMRTPERRNRSIPAKDCLVGVHDLGQVESGDGLIQRVHAKARFQRFRGAPGQYLAGVPVDDRYEIEKAPLHL